MTFKNLSAVVGIVLLSWLARFCSSFSPTHCIRQPLSSSLNMKNDIERRDFLLRNVATTLITPFLYTLPSHAMGLMQFPCREPLGNTYHFMRAGQNLMEADDIWSTNPLFLTNREAALSPEGISQVESACQVLREQDVNPSIVRYSLAASAMDTVNIIGRELKIGRDRLVPEFNFMDPRAVGKWDMLPLSTTEVAVWAMDADEAGVQGRGGKPPPNEDGTPHETLADQSVRLRQLLSVLETQYSGDTVLLIFPDSTGPALLSALIAGVPFNRVHELDFKPGEIRMDVTMDSTLAFLKNNFNREEYNAAIASGRKELKRLREMKPDDVISVKDQKLENERLEMDAAARIREEKRLAKEQAGRLAREAQDRQLKEARDNNGDESQEVATSVILGAAGLGVAGASVALTGSNNDEKETTILSTNSTEMETQDALMDVSILNGPMIATSSDDDEQTIVSTRVNGDQRATFPPLNTPTDPVKKAEEAMKEYMESDDGESGWLQVMSDLMTEDDEVEQGNADDSDNR